MDRRDEWRDWENRSFDATSAPENECNIDAMARNDDTASDARPSAPQGRIMVIGFSVIRV